MTRSAKIEVYRGHDFEMVDGEVRVVERGYRWALRASNGRVIAESSERYNRTRDIVRSLELTWPDYTVRLDKTSGKQWWLINANYTSGIPITVPEGVSLNSRRSR